MTWVGRSLTWLGYTLIGAVSIWTTFQVTQAQFKWELSAIAVKDKDQDKRLDAINSDQRFLERQIMDKLTIMHGDIRKIEGKLER